MNNISSNILQAISRGLNEALMDTDLDFNNINQKSTISNDYIKDKNAQMYLLELIGNPMDINKKSLKDALNYCAEKNIKYNPHLDGDEFGEFIEKCIEIQGDEANLNWIDTSEVTNMNSLFLCSKFNGDISEWDVSNVTDMGGMFYDSKFNRNISNWDVSNVKYMAEMFSGSQFNEDISQWNVSKVEYMIKMFKDSIFNGDISKWDVSHVTYMNFMFYNSQFNRDISNWDVSHVRDMSEMFYRSQFEGDISNWNVSKVLINYGMFDGCQIPEENKPKFNIVEGLHYNTSNKYGMAHNIILSPEEELEFYSICYHEIESAKDYSEICQDMTIEVDLGEDINILEIDGKPYQLNGIITQELKVEAATGIYAGYHSYDITEGDIEYPDGITAYEIDEETGDINEDILYYIYMNPKEQPKEAITDMSSETCQKHLVAEAKKIIEISKDSKSEEWKDFCNVVHNNFQKYKDIAIEIILNIKNYKITKDLVCLARYASIIFGIVGGCYSRKQEADDLARRYTN